MTWAGPKYFDDLGGQDLRKILSVGRNFFDRFYMDQCYTLQAQSRAVRGRAKLVCWNQNFLNFRKTSKS
jgi:hypothetical protein